MSYISIDQSVESGMPVELYQFNQSTKSWYFTNVATDIVYNVITYLATNISRGATSQSREVDKGTLSITVPRDHELGSEFIGRTVDVNTTITILRGHLTDSSVEYLPVWKGRVVASKVSGSVLELICESVFTSLRRTGLRARFQKNCRHALYSQACSVGQGNFKTNGVVTGTSGLVLSLGGIDLLPAGYLAGGMIKTLDGTLRFILDHTGNAIELNKGFAGGIQIGDTVEVFPGCDHLMSTCIDRFNNLPNFGGFPYIPLKNPFSGTSLV